MPHAFGDSSAGPGMGEAFELPGTNDPLQQALAALRALGGGDPSASVGNELMQAPPSAFVPPVQNVGTDLGFAPTGAPANVDPAGARPDFPVGIDRIGAEQGTPDLTGTAGFDPNAPVFTPPQAPRNHADAQRLEADQLARSGNAAYEAAQAEQAAKQGLMDRQARALEDSEQEQLLLNMKTERATEKANALADAETASWLTDMFNLAKQEPNPGRWWENQSGLGKALWALSLVFGAAHTAMTPGAKNAALEMVNQEIANDIAMQDARLKREMAIGQLKGQVMRDKHARNLSDIKDVHARSYTRLMALERAFSARASVPGDLDAQAAKQAALAHFEQMKLPIVGAYRQEAFQAKQQGIAQAHAATQAKLARDHAEKMAAQKFQYDLALSKVEVAATSKVALDPRNSVDSKTGEARYAEVQSGVQSGRGLVLVDEATGAPAAGTGVVLAPKDGKAFEEINRVVNLANERYTATLRLKQILMENGRELKTIPFGSWDPELREQVVKLAYTIAKDHDKRVTNQDYSKGGTEGFGADPDGTWLERTKFVVMHDAIIEKLDGDLRDMPKVVTDSLQQYNRADINGQGTKPAWDPKFLKADKVEPRSNLDVEGKPSLDINTIKEPVTRQWYEKRADEEAAHKERRGQLLPTHDQGTINSLLRATENRGPDGIAAEAKSILADVNERIERFERKENATLEGMSAWTGEPSSAEYRQYFKDVNTKRLADDIVKAEAEAAAKKLKRLEADIKVLADRERPGREWITPEMIRDKAKKMGIGRSTEVDAIYSKVKKIEAK